MAFLDTLQKLKAGQPLTLADIQAYPTQGNAILDAQGNPLVKAGTPEWTQHVGLQSQALRLSRAQNIIPAEQANQILATGGIEMFNRAQQEYDLYGKLVSPDFATMMSSPFPQPTATNPIVGGQAPAQPAPIPQVAVAQPAPQAQPVAPQAPTPQQPAQPTGKYVQYAGSPDVFDASGRYISAQEAASIPNFQSQVQQIATPRPDIKVESDFAKLAGQNITQMVKEAVAPEPQLNKPPVIQQPELQKPVQSPLIPLSQQAPTTTGVAQKPYVQYEGSPDVFERATGKYISGEEAQKIPDFFSQVEKATSVRPGVTTEENFAKLAKTNLQLQQSGATTTEQDFKANPLKAFQDTYRQIWDNLGISNVKKQIEDTLKAKNQVNNEMIDKIAEVNDNPWISEAERSRQITKLTSKYEQKNAANVESLKLLQGVFEMGQQEAQFVTTNALNAFNQQQTFDQQVLLKQMDLAEKMATTMEKKSFRDLVGADGRMHTYIVNDKGEKVVDLGLSEVAKTSDPGELTSKQTSIAIQLANSLKSHPAYTDMQDINTGMTGVEIGLSQKNGFGDITAINAFQRMVDPGATVREGDVALLQSGSAFIDKILSDYPIEKLQKGSKLPDETRRAMLKTAKELYERRANNYNETIGNQYKTLAAGSAIPFEYIGQDFLSSAIKTSPKSTPEAELTDDITTNASNYKTREDLISALTAIYPEFTKEQISKKVYATISDQQAQQITQGFK